MAILEQASVLTDAIRPVPAKELEQRLEKFRKLMDARHPDWEMAVISHKVAMYYFTGTMQEGALIITPADAVLWVRRNFVRASNESHFSDIRPMRSFREAAAFYSHVPQMIYVETKKTMLDWMKLFHKHFPFETALPLDDVMQDLRLRKMPMKSRRWSVREVSMRRSWMSAHRNSSMRASVRRSLPSRSTKKW